MASGNLSRKTVSDNVLLDKEIEIAKHPKHGRYYQGLAAMIEIFLIKRLLLLKK